MPHIEKHTPGHFCWVELVTTDQSAAESFYSKIFGGSAHNIPIGPHEVHTIFQLEDARRPQPARFVPHSSSKAFGLTGVFPSPCKARTEPPHALPNWAARSSPGPLTWEMRAAWPFCKIPPEPPSPSGSRT